MNLASLQSQVRGEVLTPASAEYDRGRTIWNAMIDRRPAAIARCTGPADIAACVRFCSRSFRRMAFICTLTVDSVMTRLRAMTLFDAPCISMRRISISRRDNDGTSPVWFSFAASVSTRVSGVRG